MRILLIDTNDKLCTEWQAAFIDVADIQIHNARFESLVSEFDCLVSPANSFGLMDGGMDAAIIDYFGPSLEERVQREIWRSFRGEQPIGTCLMVPTLHASCAWLAHCPTMRVPKDVSWTNHAYAAFLAALTSAEAAGIETLACPGLGTLSGRMPLEVAAQQMRFAYDLWQAPFTHPDWQMPSEREWRSYGRSKSDFLKRRFSAPS